MTKLTKEAAQRMADRRKRIGIFENKMMEFSDGYEFRPLQIYNFSICYCYDTKNWMIDMSDKIIKPMSIYMTEARAEKAVEWANKHYPEGL